MGVLTAIWPSLSRQTAMASSAVDLRITSLFLSLQITFISGGVETLLTTNRHAKPPLNLAHDGVLNLTISQERIVSPTVFGCVFGHGACAYGRATLESVHMQTMEPSMLI